MRGDEGPLPGSPEPGALPQIARLQQDGLLLLAGLAMLWAALVA